MGILQLPTQIPAMVGVQPANKFMITSDSLATITAAGYLNAVDLQSNPIAASDVLQILYSYNQQTNSGTYGIFTVSISNGSITLVQWANPGDVLLPVVSGDFANFNGTTGQIKDAGYSPSNAAKTKVVMANAATVANHIMVSTDTAGTSGNLAGTAINDGSVQAGRSTVAGSLISYPSSATSGSLSLTAVANAGDYANVISNESFGQASTLKIADPANANSYLAQASQASPLVSGNLVQASGVKGILVDSGITAGGLQILSASITLNQAAVQAMYATPFQIIAAPASGHVIVPVFATIYTNFQTAAFSSGGVAILQYDNTAHGAGTNALAATIPQAEINAASSQIYSLAGASASALTGITAKGLFLSNQTGAFAGGNAASTVVVTVSYYLISASV